MWPAPIATLPVTRRSSGSGEAVAAGAIPFSVQGPENALRLDGGRTMGWEIADQAAAAGVVLDRVFVQVGGGAFAASVGAGLGPLVRLDTVQAAGCAPLAAAWERAASVDDPVRHWTDVMRAWPNPHSAADGILDDETYDWIADVDAMRRSGGDPVDRVRNRDPPGARTRRCRRLLRERHGRGPVSPGCSTAESSWAPTNGSPSSCRERRRTDAISGRRHALHRDIAPSHDAGAGGPPVGRGRQASGWLGRDTASISKRTTPSGPRRTTNDSSPCSGWSGNVP